MLAPLVSFTTRKWNETFIYSLFTFVEPSRHVITFSIYRIIERIASLDLKLLDLVKINWFGFTVLIDVALTCKVFGQCVHVSNRRDACCHIRPLHLADVEVGRVEVQVVGGVVVLPGAATSPLAEDFAAQHGSCRHIGNVWI